MTPLAKRLTWGIALSVALNLLLAGILIGRRFHHPPGPDRPPFAREHGPRRGPMRGLLREHRAELHERGRAMREAQKAARGALERDPFDRAALDQALEKVRDETNASQLLVHRALAEQAAKGSVDERRKLGRAIERAGLDGVGSRPGPR